MNKKPEDILVILLPIFLISEIASAPKIESDSNKLSHLASALIEFFDSVESLNDQFFSLEAILKARGSVNLSQFSEYITTLSNLKISNFDNTMTIPHFMPNELSFLWPYYALVRQKLLSESQKIYIDPENLYKIRVMILTQHQEMIEYSRLSTEVSNIIITHFRHLTRIVDLLFYIAIFKEKCPKIYTLFFNATPSEDKFALIKHVFKTIKNYEKIFHIFHSDSASTDSSDSELTMIHKNYVFIKYAGEELKVFVSRKLSSGQSHDDQEYLDNKTLNNPNFSAFMKSALSTLSKIENKTVPIKKESKGDGKKEYNPIQTPSLPFTVIQYSERPHFDKNVDEADQIFYQKSHIREPSNILNQDEDPFNPLSVKPKDVPSYARQIIRAKAYSAFVTKSKLPLLASYKLPTLSQLSFLVQSITQEPFSSPATNNDMHRILFLGSLITGIYTPRLVHLLIRSTSENNHTIDVIKGSMLYITLTNNIIDRVNEANKKIFIKPKNIMTYKLPYLLSQAFNILIRKQELLQTFDEIIYKDEINSYLDQLPFKIHFTLNFISEIGLTYQRHEFDPGTHAMLCTSRIQQDDVAKLTYRTTKQISQRFSNWLMKFSSKIGSEEALSKALNLRSSISSGIAFNDIFTGFGLSPKDEVVKQFLSEIFHLIQQCSDINIRFNLFGIYLRFAMSILLGTRTFDQSADFSRISFETGVLILSEKAQTELAGARIIPVCDLMKKLILNYIEYSKEIETSQPIIRPQFVFNEKIEKINNDSLVSFIATFFPDEKFLIEFTKSVSLNIGRHIVSSKAESTPDISSFCLEAFMGHHIAGAEHFGKFSNFDLPDYLNTMKKMQERLINLYDIRMIR